MTRDEAIKELKEYEDGLDLEYATPFDKAILYAIKVIEQEPILDKIRAEIEFEVDHRTNMLCAEDVFAILDKYKSESEGKDTDKCTYKETGCGSCKRQLDCPMNVDKAESEAEDGKID